MTRSQLIMTVLKFVEQSAFTIPIELEEYKANKDLVAINDLSLDGAFFMDELDYVELTMEMEDELSIKMSDSDWPDWYKGDVTIRDLVSAMISSGVLKITD